MSTKLVFVAIIHIDGNGDAHETAARVEPADMDRIESVFHRTLDVTGAERNVLLDQLCGSN
jgi:hypothetical protein